MFGGKGYLVGLRGVWEVVEVLVGSYGEWVRWDVVGVDGDGCYFGMVEILVVLNK